jgi:hypothetical protein
VCDAQDSSGQEKTISDDEKHKRFIKSVYRAKETIFDLIACNVGMWGSHTAKFVTLTFSEKIYDIKAANAEFTRFIKDLNYYVYDSKQAVLKYVCIPELQSRGVWHFHVLFFNLPLIPVNISKAMALCEKGVLPWGAWANLQDIWGCGFVGINVIKHSARVAAYVTKYLTKGIDVGIDGKVNYGKSDSDEGLKRLSDYGLYKSLGLENMKRYQASRGLIKPQVYHILGERGEVSELYQKLQREGKLLFLDQAKKTINSFDGENKYRGKYVIMNFRLNKKHLPSFVEKLDRLAYNTRQNYYCQISGRKLKYHSIDMTKEARRRVTKFYTAGYMTDEQINSLFSTEVMIC